MRRASVWGTPPGRAAAAEDPPLDAAREPRPGVWRSLVARRGLPAPRRPRPLRRGRAPPSGPPGAASVAATASFAAGPGPASARRAGVESQPELLPAAPP